ncbi:hypothetical protein PVAP13_7KG043609 [Panicum virgatum]|uniref:Uncharacterized protein n=1 Tax=Panicum virgatum TaxID=38727 RepID=A0A8T0QB64_PANVG|nr:hypothetical protein PVAP13_7KG043609 [Panicum virgatum]
MSMPRACPSTPRPAERAALLPREPSLALALTERRRTLAAAHVHLRTGTPHMTAPTPGMSRPCTHCTGPPRRGRAASRHVRAHATCRAHGSTHTFITLTRMRMLMHMHTPLSRHALEPCLDLVGPPFAIAPSDLGPSVARPPSLRCRISTRVVSPSPPGDPPPFHPSSLPCDSVPPRPQSTGCSDACLTRPTTVSPPPLFLPCSRRLAHARPALPRCRSSLTSPPSLPPDLAQTAPSTAVARALARRSSPPARRSKKEEEAREAEKRRRTPTGEHHKPERKKAQNSGTHRPEKEGDVTTRDQVISGGRREWKGRKEEEEKKRRWACEPKIQAGLLSRDPSWPASRSMKPSQSIKPEPS